MIVDVHSHTPRHRVPPSAPPASTDIAPMRPDKPNLAAYTWDDYLTAMAPVDRAICFNIAAPPPGDPHHRTESFLDDAQTINDQTATFVRAHPDKLLGFLSVHPRDPHALDEIDRAVKDLGLRGIKLGANYQNFDPLGEDAFRIYARAQELRLPILFHQGTSPVRFADLDYAHPRHADRIATRFPELRIVLAHLGHPWQLDCICVIRKHPNVYADISANFYRPWSYYNALRYATEWSVLPKLLFASDYPAATPEETLAAIPRINDAIAGSGLPPVPVDEFAKVIHRDSLGLLGLA
jgi:predicted TIM-barrel fold metal-dependent hydrolase